MTINERVHSIIDSMVGLGDGHDNASVEKMIYLAYYIGREQAVKEVSDMYTEHIKKQHVRADACRYKNMANMVVGKETYLYHGDYGMPMTTMFGNDMADI